MTVADPARSLRVITCGEALIAALPDRPVTLAGGEPLRLYLGGAEVNFAVGIRRLGLDARFVGRVGNDTLGSLVLTTLECEDVDVTHVRRNDGVSGLYLREWLADGQRRPLYYRAHSAGSTFGPEDWPSDTNDVDWLHITGITPALSIPCRDAVMAALAWANDHAIPVSFDPNYRHQLWTREEARAVLLPMVAHCQVLLLGTGEGDLLFGTDDPDTIIERATLMNVAVVVVKQGSEGATAQSAGEFWRQQALDVEALDPVGAGDAFDAGFVAGMLGGASLNEAMTLATYCGAKVTERPGEHEGFPRRNELPAGVLPKAWVSDSSALGGN